MDVATISALAATAAAIGAFSVAGVQLYVGHRQSEAALKAADAALMNAQSAGRHTVAEFRQSWMDKVIDALSDYHAILMSVDDDHSLSPDDHMKLTALWTRCKVFPAKASVLVSTNRILALVTLRRWLRHRWHHSSAA